MREPKAKSSRAPWRSALAMLFLAAAFAPPQALAADEASVVAAFQRSNAALDAGDIAGAIRHGGEALAQSREVLGDTHATTGVLAFNLASLQQSELQWEAARGSYQLALAAYAAEHGPESPELLPVLEGLAKSEDETRAFGDALETWQRVLQIHQAAHGAESEQTAQTYQQLGLSARGAGKLKASRNYGNRALKIYRQIHGGRSSEVGTLLLGLAVLDMQLGELGKAQEKVEKGLAIVEETLPLEHPTRIAANEFLAGTLEQAGQTAKARRHRKDADEGKRIAERNERRARAEARREHSE